MKRFFAFILSLLAISATQAQAPKEKSLLWKIEKDGQPSSYLYGTFHMLCKDDFYMPDTIKNLVASCKVMYLEIDIDDPAMMGKMFKHINMKDSHTIKEYIPSNEYDTIAKLFKQKTGMPLNSVQQYKPFMLSSLLYPALINCKTVAFEKEFEQLAKSNKMEIKGLETIESQLAIFDSIPYEQQAKALVRMLYETDKSKKQLNKMVTLYKKQDIKKMEALTKGDTDFGDNEGILIDNRNQNWIPVIEQAIADKSVFFAVGAGHLGGKKGVIHLLRQKGYTVTPIKYSYLQHQ